MLWWQMRKWSQCSGQPPVKQIFWWPTIRSFFLWPNLLRVCGLCKCNPSSLKQKCNLSTDSDGFWLSQAQGRSLNNIFSWGRRKHFLTFWSSLSFFLVVLLYLGAWRGSDMLWNASCHFNEATLDHEKQVLAFLCHYIFLSSISLIKIRICDHQHVFQNTNIIKMNVF